MKSLHRWKLFVAAGFAAMMTWPSSATAQSLRCNSRLMSPGDTAYELEAHCGAPDHITRRRVMTAVSAGVGGVGVEVSRTYEMAETWIYHQDVGRMARFVDVRRGKIAGIRVVNIRVVDDPTRCERALSPGRTLLGEARIACGEPMDTSRWEEERTRVHASGAGVAQLNTHERWVYDLGPGRFLRILNFQNDKLVSVETGRRSRRTKQAN